MSASFALLSKSVHESDFMVAIIKCGKVSFLLFSLHIDAAIITFLGGVTKCLIKARKSDLF